MKALFTLISFFISVSVFASEAGFKNGNDLQVTDLRGQVQVQCRNSVGRIFFINYNCAGYITSPDAFDVFKLDPTVDADNVLLTSHQQNGKIVRKSSRFNSETGESRSEFNLTVSTLTQTPLVSLGRNTITYDVAKGNQVVASGDFLMTVAYLGVNQCYYTTMYDASGFLCGNQMEACREYFREQNWCSNRSDSKDSVKKFSATL